MIKSSQLCMEFDHVQSHSLTPIRDYKNDFFHKNDGKLPLHNRFPLRQHTLLRKQSDSNFNRSLKRPKELELCDLQTPSPKRQYSPLNIKQFEDKLTLNCSSPLAPTNQNNIRKYALTLRTLHESELSYLQQLKNITEVYRKKMNESKQYKNKILEISSGDEILLFGNIDTISSISALFIKGFEETFCKVLEFQNFNELSWDLVMQKPELQKKLVSEINIGKLFNVNYLRIKSTYLSYCISHKNQMDLLDLISTGNSSIFDKWNKECFMEVNGVSLASLLKMPILRTREWLVILDQLVLNSSFIKNTEKYHILIQAQKQYKEFVDQTKNEMKEYEQNSSYDYSLTPMEIIQDYSNFYLPKSAGPEDKPSTSIEAEEANENPYAIGQTNTRSFCSTSSKYSSIYEESMILPLQENKESNDLSKFLVIGENSTNLNSMKLSDFILLFKKIHKKLKFLFNHINNSDYLAIIKLQDNFLSYWLSIVNCFSNSSTFQHISDKWLEYKQKINFQKEEISTWKILELQPNVLDLLKLLLEKSALVKQTINDFESLKKDYYSFLRNHRKNHNIQNDVLGKHFIMLQQKLLTDLPVYIDLVHQLTHVLIIHYSKCLAQYFEILVGGPIELKEELEKITENELKQTPNYDIYKNYTINRHTLKYEVRKASIVPESSKILRSLFEL